MKTRFVQFSEMKWLDEEEINEYNKVYMNALLNVRKAQQNGTITDDLYKTVCRYEEGVSVEKGYYIANLHYDLYKACETHSGYELLEKRILYFLNKCDKESLLRDCCSLFKGDFRYLLIEKYNLHRDEIWDKTNSYIVDKFCNASEKNIWNKFLSLGGKDFDVQ